MVTNVPYQLGSAEEAEYRREEAAATDTGPVTR